MAGLEIPGMGSALEADSVNLQEDLERQHRRRLQERPAMSSGVCAILPNGIARRDDVEIGCRRRPDPHGRIDRGADADRSWRYLRRVE